MPENFIEVGPKRSHSLNAGTPHGQDGSIEQSACLTFSLILSHSMWAMRLYLQRGQVSSMTFLWIQIHWTICDLGIMASHDTKLNVKHSLRCDFVVTGELQKAGTQ